jgi:hypothetical protein
MGAIIANDAKSMNYLSQYIEMGLIAKKFSPTDSLRFKCTFKEENKLKNVLE